MMNARKTAILASVVLCASCGKKDLDRATALAILQRQPTVRVQGIFSGIGFTIAGPSNAAYTRLVQEGVLTCVNAGYCYPGPNGTGLSSISNGDFLVFDAGDRYVAGVSGIVMQDSNTAVVQANMGFSNSVLYGRYHTLLNEVASSTGIGGLPFGGEPLPKATAPEFRQFTFRRFDDGWRVVDYNP